jgi:carotenoid cleavage dioxygenase-like enzyme
MGKQKLLVVEDDKGLQKQLRWSFDTWDVVVADDRASALAQVRRHQPAVVTMDLGLPPDPDGAAEDDGWLLAFVYDANDDRSDFVVLDARDLTADPVAVVHLPTRVPHGFHGSWLPAG